MKTLILICFCFLTISTFSQTAEDTTVYQVVEQMPQFPGGDDALLRYLGTNIKYPDKFKDANIQGTVYIQFVVNTDGSISDAATLRGITGPGGKECNEEALRVIKIMPKWIPGKQNGKNVRVQYNLPIRFGLR